jgi:hypothetical protein
LPSSGRPQEGDQASYDNSKARAHNPDSPDRRPPVCAVAKIIHVGRLGVALAEGAGALGRLLGTRRPGVHSVVQQGPAELYEVGPRWRGVAVNQDDPDDRMTPTR